MMTAIQLELFEENSEIDILRKEMSHMRTSQDNVRKGMFARHAELVKMYLKQQDEIEILRSMLLKVQK